MNSDLNSFFLAKPTRNNVSEFKPLRDFINNYPIQELKPQMRKLQKDFPYYRPIKGDGNCFYRACMFLYLSSVDLTDFATVFPPAPIFNCIDLPFFNDGSYSSEQILYYIWARFLQPLQNKLTEEREKKLTLLFNSSQMFDAIMIAYFRSLNHAYLKLNQDKFAAYTSDGIASELKKVLTYGRQSQGVEIYSLAELLQAKITIMMTHKVTLKAVEYLQEGLYNFRLFYRPGHYDILASDPSQNKGKSKLDTVIPIVKSVSSIIPYEQANFTKQSQIQPTRKSEVILNTISTQDSGQIHTTSQDTHNNIYKNSLLSNRSSGLSKKSKKQQPFTQKQSAKIDNLQSFIHQPQKVTQPQPPIQCKQQPTTTMALNLRVWVQGLTILIFFVTILSSRLYV